MAQNPKPVQDITAALRKKNDIDTFVACLLPQVSVRVGACARDFSAIKHLRTIFANCCLPPTLPDDRSMHIVPQGYQKRVFRRGELRERTKNESTEERSKEERIENARIYKVHVKSRHP